MASITIKNIPEELYEKLRFAASLNRRSINSEMICCLEKVLLPQRLTIGERLQKARWIRSKIDHEKINPDEISQAISQGRP